jgi:hypothetical protein
MTVSSTTVKNSYSGNGSTTVFAYTYRIFADSDLQVIIRSAAGTETTKTITTHYTVAGAGDANGGSVTFTPGNVPTATETVVLRREVPQTQAIDYIANDPFPAESHEEGLDRATMNIQQLQEEVDRSIKLSRTNTMTSTEFTVDAADRANKILAFDATGEISVTQELGTYKGTSPTTTTEAFVVRDIVKGSTPAELNNIYICILASPVGTLLTNTTYWVLIVDAVSAAASEVAAAASAAAAQLSADDAAADLVLTNADVVLTNADVVSTNADVVLTNADAAATAADLVATNQDTIDTAADLVATNQDTIDTAADLVATNQDTIDTAADVVLTNADVLLTNADVVLTHADVVLTNADVVSTGLDKAATNADVLLTAADVISSAASAAAAAASADAFDDVYLGSKASDPTTDNDGDPLAAGMLYYNTTSNIMRIYSGSAWENVAVSTAGFATLAGVETFTNKTLTSPKINEDVVVTSTATELNILDGVTSTTAELNTLDGLSRGSILYGNASAATTILTKGTVGQVLTSDGTDISWDDAFSGIAWQSVQTTGFTAAVGNAYPCDTTSAAFTVTLPASASVGDQVQIVDYAGTFATNNITLTSSLNIEGAADDKLLTTNREGVTITYVDATQGWVASSGVNSGTEALDPLPPYNIDFLVIAGGGGGGGSPTGGGGAGGYRTSTQSVSVSTLITITVGDGGAGGNPEPSQTSGTNGSDSSISGSGLTTITSAGGGGGGSAVSSPNQNGKNGGSGGGGGSTPTPANTSTGGTGNTPSTSPSQGNNGGTGTTDAASYRSGGGGGGANANGSNASGGNGGAGGAGTASSITGSSVTRAGGGGGSGTASLGVGGAGGGGAGGDIGTNGTAGTVNTGGGGGSGGSPSSWTGNAGGKGVVILSMPLAKFSNTTTGSPTESDDGTTKVLIFNGDGSYTA